MSKLLRWRWRSGSRKRARSVDENPGGNAKGLRLLVPETDDPEMMSEMQPDIIAIHSINGHFTKTWTHENGRNWLHFLEGDIPGSRIFSFGYNATVAFTCSKGGIDDFARRLLFDIKMHRNLPKLKARPMIFVCHSMGGIVLKRALSIAKLEPDEFDEVRRPTRAIFFLSTPHKGSDSVKWPKLLASIANATTYAINAQVGTARSDLLTLLETNSNELSRISDDFRKYGDKIKIFSFYEDTSTPPLSKLIVEKSSAVIGFSDEMFLQLEGCNHRTVCRFADVTDINYQRILHEMQKLNKTEHTDSVPSNMDGRLIQNSIPVSAFDQSLNEDISKLPWASEASFDSHHLQHLPKCYDGTREDLLSEIKAWCENPETTVYWLKGMAGTGKSTVARTVARHLKSKNLLAGSFFFSKDQKDVSHANKFVTTVAVQMADLVLGFKRCLSNALQESSRIAEKSLEEQWNTLVLRPLQQCTVSSDQRSIRHLFYVLDALDECEGEKDVQLLLQLFADSASALRNAGCNSPFRVFLFMTSRPENYIQFGVRGQDTAQTLFHLHDIDKDVVDKDIRIFISVELRKPGERLHPEYIDELCKRSQQVFIYASTLCRVILEDSEVRTLDEAFRSLLQGKDLLQGENRVLDGLNIYPAIIERWLGKAPSLHEELLEILGVIVSLKDALPTTAIAQLLKLERDTLSARIRPLLSVLDIPKNDYSAPIRLLHPSFRDYVLTKRIQPRQSQERLLHLCLDIMDKYLKRDICNLQKPAANVESVSTTTLIENIPTALRYACQYWIQHLSESGLQLADGCKVHRFLIKNFLNWIEVLSLLRKTPEAFTGVRAIRSLMNDMKHSDMYAFVHDAERFLMYSRAPIEQFPLQVYYSSLLFSPKNSVVRKHFSDQISEWNVASTPANWTALLQTLEGHSGWVRSVAFSPDGRTIASASDDRTVRLWDSATGAALKTLEGHSGWVRSVAFSPDGRTIASASSDGTVRLWDSATGAALKTLGGHSNWFGAATFLLDNLIFPTLNDNNGS